MVKIPYTSSKKRSRRKPTVITEKIYLSSLTDAEK